MPKTRLAELSYKRLSGTCEWIIRTPIVQQFLDDSEESRILRCYGKPGSGKTYMSSRLIQELQDRHSASSINSDASVTYFFCSKNNNDPQWNSTKSILTSLLCQVLLKNLRRSDFIPILHANIPGLHEATSQARNINVNVDLVECVLLILISKLRRCW